MGWKEITEDNEWYVHWMFDHEVPFLIGFMEDGVTTCYSQIISNVPIHRMAKRGGYYFYEIPPLILIPIKKEKTSL